MDFVRVMDKEGRPLMPTRRFGWVRWALKNKLAERACRDPFTVRLLYGPKTHVIQAVMGGVDTGRDHMGVAAVREDGKCLFLAIVETRNRDIPNLMEERAMYRRASRAGERAVRKRRAVAAGTVMAGGERKRILPGCEKPILNKVITNSEARFMNRGRPEGWRTPTAEQLFRTHLNAIRKAFKHLPISGLASEYAKFTFLQLANPGKFLTADDYQRGAMFGYDGDPVAALEDWQHGKCLLCGETAAEGKGIDVIHHVIPRSKGGANSLANYAGLCRECHDKVHKDAKAAEKLLKTKKGELKKYGAASVLNQVMPALDAEFRRMFPSAFVAVHGYETTKFREKHDVRKDHDVDAYCIAVLGLMAQGKMPTVAPPEPGDGRTIVQYRRHDRQMIHAQRNRYYKLDGKTVAHNRHKACMADPREKGKGKEKKQAVDSLAEWRDRAAKKIGKDKVRRMISTMDAVPSKRAMNTMGRMLPGAIFRYGDGGTYLMSGNHGENRINAYGCKVEGKGGKIVNREFNRSSVGYLRRNTGLVYAPR